MSFQTDSDTTDEQWTIEMSAKVIADALLSSPTFIRQVATLVLVELTKQARRKGNVLGKWAQRQLPDSVKNQVPGTKHIS